MKNKHLKAIGLPLVCMLIGCTPTTPIPVPPPPEPVHEHDFDTRWSKDDEKHWHRCKGDGCKERKDEGLHEYWEDGKCKICDYKYGYVKKESPFLISDLEPSVIPNEGDINVCVIEIDFPYNKGGNVPLYSFDSSTQQRINYWYEGTTPKTGKPSFVEYYKNLSHGKLIFHPEIFHYNYSGSDTAQDIQEDSSLQKLCAMLINSVEAVEEYVGDDFAKKFDKNSDGYIDALHFITNCGVSTWSTPLWPHMNTLNYKLDGKTGIGVYSLNALSHFEDSTTAIHETGHMLGLQDYYNYDRNSFVDFVGHLDMQDNNVGDWNAFSKLQVGFIKPTVYTGEKNSTTIKLGTGDEDCLIVPADYTTWNGTPFDEYFLFELFTTEVENNSRYYNSIYPNFEYGVKAYHVFGKYSAYNGNYTEKYSINTLADLEKAQRNNEYIAFAASNSTTTDNVQTITYKNYPLLQVIQKGGVNTFVTNGSRLSPNDLFMTNDVFTFEKYKTFLRKDARAMFNTVKKESFPYTITFDSVTKDSFQVTITK